MGAITTVTKRRHDLGRLFNAMEATIAPLWPLQDFVAVNPFLGRTATDFLTARQEIRRIGDAELLMPLSYYRGLFENGEFTRDDLCEALTLCRDAYGDWFPETDWDPDDVIGLLQGAASAVEDPNSDAEARAVWTVALLTDRTRLTDWSTQIVEEISKFCAAHYDQGQALWRSPWKDLPLYDAWKHFAAYDRRPELLGLKGFRTFVAGLPATPEEAVAVMLETLRVPPDRAEEFLLGQLASIPGWSSYVKYRIREAAAAGRTDHDLRGLLAIRLAFDTALAANVTGAADRLFASPQPDRTPRRHVLLRYLCLTATEIAYRRSLLALLQSRAEPVAPKRNNHRVSVQMVFCIDVRSEVMRRHLEYVSGEIQTFGFAGFFGIPMEYIPMDEEHGNAQCPVLLNPAIRVRESLRVTDQCCDHDSGHLETPPRAIEAVNVRRRAVRAGRTAMKVFQTSASSCFSFVESLGLLSLGGLIANALHRPRRVENGRFDGVRAADRDNVGPIFDVQGDTGLTLPQQTDLAFGMLKNLGLTAERSFAKMVVLCGHGSVTYNNPYKAGLDCGACGGHTGESNARIMAQILNNADVRKGLIDRGVVIPADTWFCAALHQTTTDEIRFYDTQSLPTNHAELFQDLRDWTAAAGRLTQAERGLRMNDASLPDEFTRRSRDWAEIRPEWGLAGNAAFVVAPRERTAGRDLGGRTFLHNYDHRNDPDLKILELIMTAPMIVTNWINLQYYASVADNRTYGSGNKVIHNVVGRLGILEGNGGDLRSGLPWQSVHDGVRLRHDPLRLLVVIEAPRDAVQSIIEKHAHVRELFDNGWLALTVIDNNRFFRYAPRGDWAEVSPVGSSRHLQTA